MEEKTIDFSGDTKEVPTQSVNILTDKDVFQLGKWILLALGIMLISVCISYIWLSQEKYNAMKDVFEFAKIFIPSLISLIIGFYFKNI